MSARSKHPCTSVACARTTAVTALESMNPGGGAEGAGRLTTADVDSFEGVGRAAGRGDDSSAGGGAGRGASSAGAGGGVGADPDDAPLAFRREVSRLDDGSLAAT